MTNRPILPRWQFFDANGDPLSGGKLYWYETGTSTPKATYSDAGLTTPNANPIILNAAGYAGDIFMGADDYKLVVTNSADVTQYTTDPVFAVPAALRATNTNSQTGAYTIVAADNAKTILAEGTWTLTLLAAATAGDGYRFTIINTGDGVITVDPAAAELINGLSTITVPSGFSETIVCDGAAWYTSGGTAERHIRTQTLTGTATEVDFTLPSPDLIYKLRITNAASSAGSPLLLRFSTDGGATFLAGASDYEYALVYNGESTVAGIGDETAAAIILTTSLESGGGVNGSIEFTPGSASQRATVFAGQTVAAEPSGTYFRTHAVGGRAAANAAVDAVRVTLSSGNIAVGSRFSLYAIRP